MGTVIPFKPRPRPEATPIAPHDGYMPPADLALYWKQIEAACLDAEQALKRYRETSWPQSE